MSTVKLVNAFSLNMLKGGLYRVVAERIDLQAARAMVWDGFISYIGHADMARMLSELLASEVEVYRGNLEIEDGEALLVAQYSGPRLPEGATKLPEGARIDFWRVEVDELDELD